MPGSFSPNRYDSMIYRRCGRSGLLLPAISLGAWETFGGYRGESTARDCLFRAFDLGITHFDFANNYGTPPGNAEIVCGKIIRDMPRDELILSSKAGWRMWPGPYGDWGSRKYLIASCDQSLKRMGIDYFDIFYSHRPDPETPLDETLGALETLVKQGKALYAGISSYNGAQYADAVRVMQNRGWSPITIHQPCYNLLDRQVEWDLLPLAQRFGTGIIAFCPLASGLLTDKYLGSDIPPQSRVAQKWGKPWLDKNLTPHRRQILNDLNKIARSRNQTLAQMSLAWLLRLPAVTSALIGASSVQQIEENVAALQNLTFSDEELRQIDLLAPAHQAGR